MVDVEVRKTQSCFKTIIDKLVVPPILDMGTTIIDINKPWLFFKNKLGEYHRRCIIGWKVEC
jgi:hypothetical protein